MTYIIKQHQHKKITLSKSGTYTIRLVGEGAEVNIIGLFSLNNQDSLELNVTIIHEAPRTNANTTLKAIVDDSATATINGTIIVRPKAQVTNSFLTEKVLLLSPKATAHAIPNLEIEANDVKCSHAATVSTIDEEQLFYLQSRGIEENQAKHLIAQGFLAS